MTTEKPSLSGYISTRYVRTLNNRNCWFISLSLRIPAGADYGLINLMSLVAPLYNHVFTCALTLCIRMHMRGFSPNLSMHDNLIVSHTVNPQL